jgi:uncharacterized protein YbaP (TraB family)
MKQKPPALVQLREYQKLGSVDEISKQLNLLKDLGTSDEIAYLFDCVSDLIRAHKDLQKRYDLLVQSEALLKETEVIREHHNKRRGSESSLKIC